MRRDIEYTKNAMAAAIRRPKTAVPGRPRITRSVGIGGMAGAV
jgi:hypothetical protein